MKRIAFVFGTRPEIIKLAPVIKECMRTKTDFLTIHTGQHYSENMDAIFLKNLRLPAMDHNLHVGSGTHGDQTARMIQGIESILLQDDADVVLVQGDTNSVLAGALVASKLHKPIGHVEGGLRSYDRKMPEEVNRVLTGAVSSFHFVPTEEARSNLLKEGMDDSLIHITGNTIVDALYQNVKIAKDHSSIIKKLKLKKNKYFLITAHRPENTDSKANLTAILNGFRMIAKEYDIPLVWPIHPRTNKQIEKFGLTNKLTSIQGLHLIEPLGFFDFISLEDNARLIITDSGGLQEEGCILQTPCVTLRNNTERPESISVGANILVGQNTQKIRSAVRKMLTIKRKWNNPFGDGQSSKRIIDILKGSITSTK